MVCLVRSAFFLLSCLLINIPGSKQRKMENSNLATLVMSYSKLNFARTINTPIINTSITRADKASGAQPSTMKLMILPTNKTPINNIDAKNQVLFCVNKPINIINEQAINIPLGWLEYY